jgi:hypothetical protein
MAVTAVPALLLNRLSCILYNIKPQLVNTLIYYTKYGVKSTKS